MVYTHYGQKRNKQTDFNQYRCERSEHIIKGGKKKTNQKI